MRTYSDRVRASLVTSEARPGADEDAAGVLGDVAVLLDGAGIPQRFRAGCHHSVAWFSHTLAAHLLARATDPALSLRESLAAAIAEVRALHEHECDLEAGSPSATVVAVRRAGEQLEHLVLCDSSLLLHGRDGTVRRLTDDRVDHLVIPGDAGGPAGGPGTERASRSGGAPRTADEIEALRNAPGGFWLARHEPEAAEEALIGSVPLAELEAVHLVSDGVTRAVDLLGTHTASTLSRALLSAPGEVITQLRAAERDLPEAMRPRKIHDDATALTLRW